MKTKFLVLGCFIAAILSSTAFALTINEQVTAVYVGEHPKVWSVKAAKKESGLIQFTVVRTLSEPKYLVAHLAVHHAGRLIVTSDTPLFGKRKDSTFYFSISTEDIAESTFELGEHGLGSTVDGVQTDIPVVGGIVYQFRLLDFISEDVLKPGLGK